MKDIKCIHLSVSAANFQYGSFIGVHVDFYLLSIIFCVFICLQSFSHILPRAKTHYVAKNNFELRVQLPLPAKWYELQKHAIISGKIILLFNVAWKLFFFFQLVLSQMQVLELWDFKSGE